MVPLVARRRRRTSGPPLPLVLATRGGGQNRGHAATACRSARPSCEAMAARAVNIVDGGAAHGDTGTVGQSVSRTLAGCWLAARLHPWPRDPDGYRFHRRTLAVLDG